MTRRPLIASLALLALPALAACAQQPTPVPVPAAQAHRDSLADPTLIPAGYGSLRQDDIAIRLDIQQLQVKAIPLDEAVIRVLSPDSYRALHELVESRRTRIEEIARRRGLQQYHVWYVSYFALQPDVPYSPQEFTVLNNGRQYRPIDILPLSGGFGGPRLRLRETQAALYVFDGDVDAQQPLTVQVESSSSDAWQQTIRRIERERALIRSRAMQSQGTAPRSE